MTKHYMVDIETTGLRPDRHAVIQIAAIRFDLDKRTVDHNDMFKASLWMPTTRCWDEGTKQWWRGKREVYDQIIAKVEDPAEVMKRFSMWCYTDGERSTDRYMWAKNVQFDYQFLSSYFHDYDVTHPFHYRCLNDIKCFLRGHFYPNPIPDVQTDVEGTHDALIDCISQIDYLFKALNYTE